MNLLHPADLNGNPEIYRWCLMMISEFLSAQDVYSDFRASSKQQLLDALAQRAAIRLHSSAQQFSTELAKREELGSTGMGRGVAIPHVRIPSIERPFGMFVRLNKAIDFGAIDGKPVDLVFLLILPSDANSSLEALAKVARKLSGAPEKLRAAETAEDMYNLIVA